MEKDWPTNQIGKKKQNNRYTISAKIFRTVSNYGEKTIRKIEAKPREEIERRKRACKTSWKAHGRFQTGELDERDISNADETHFVINMDSRQCLGLYEDEEFNYADVTFGGEDMTMLVRFTKSTSSIIAPPLMIFKYESKNYPMRVAHGNVLGMAYRTRPGGRIYQ